MVSSASHSAEVHDGFVVLRAPGGPPDSFRLYAALTRELERALCSLSGSSSPSSSASSASSAPPPPPPPPPPTYREFCSRVAANRERTVSETWGLMLTALPGVGAAAAGALSASWPTPALLWRAMRAEAERAAASSSGEDAAAASIALARAAVVSMLAAVPRAVGASGAASAAATAPTLGRAAAAAAVDALTDAGAALLPPRASSASR